jgi:hypothetical protein
VTAKYEFYEIVRIRAPKKHGEEGTVLGKSQDSMGKWGYAVYVHSSEEVWNFREDEIESTGRMNNREAFYDGTGITVQVDPTTGEGSLAEPEGPASSS